MKKLLDYIKLIIIIAITDIILMYLLIYLTGSRVSGAGNSVFFGPFIGNFIFAVLGKDSFKRKIFFWILTSVLAFFISYVGMLFIFIENVFITFIIFDVVPLIISWELVRLLSKRS